MRCGESRAEVVRLDDEGGNEREEEKESRNLLFRSQLHQSENARSTCINMSARYSKRFSRARSGLRAKLV